MKYFIFLIVIFTSTSIQAQKSHEYVSDSIKTKKIFFNDGVLAKIVWRGKDYKVDSLKTYHKSGDLKEVFYHDEKGRFLRGQQFNAKGKLLTSWTFKKGRLLKRTDHFIEFNVKNKQFTIRVHSSLKSCNEKLLSNPNSFGAFYGRAMSRAQLGNTTLAYRDLKKLENILNKGKNFKNKSPMLAAVYDHLGSFYSGYEMENHAIHYKIKAINTSPKESRLYYNLGAYLSTINVNDLAISYLNIAIEMVPKHGFAHWLLGITYSDLGEYEKAMKYINIAFEHEDGIYKRNSGTAERDLRTTRGLIHHKLGNSKKGISDLKGALKINKNNSFALRNLGVIYHDLGMYSKACELLQKSKDLAYEKVHDKNDLQMYLDNACNKRVSTNFEKPVLASIYPNPTQDFIQIKSYDFQNFEFEIYSFDSKLVKKGISQNKTISLYDLPNGLYILKIINEKSPQEFKVVKK